MTKEVLRTAINEILDGNDPGKYDDELTMLLSLVNISSEENVAAAWSEIHIDYSTEESD